MLIIAADLFLPAFLLAPDPKTKNRSLFLAEDEAGWLVQHVALTRRNLVWTIEGVTLPSLRIAFLAILRPNSIEVQS